jgi:alkanesulfonate monooxygenase SsuD/methylene tetrahydromethanopterin reductase-like flavin-dependent oxidoreductase (luciferase family)
LFGRRNGSQSPDGLFDEAADAVEVVRRLWDSWEDDAVIRDVSTGRYIDRNKLHYIDFHGEHFSVKGPSITPRPPQGQPVVAALAHARRIYEFAAASSDLVFITPTDDAGARAIVDEVHAAGGAHLKIFADVVVTFGGDAEFGSDALIFTGGAKELVELLLEWQRLGIDGARLRPAVNASDLPVIVDEVVPLLQRAGRFRTSYPPSETLRQRLGLPVAPNRYTEVTP